MELLDMVPAEAIALRLYSLPAVATTVGSLCAWLVAALAAAVGLWRIRAVGSSNKPSAGVHSALVDDMQQSPLPSPVIDQPRPRAQAEPASPSEPSTPSKVLFTAYYGGSGADDDDGVVDGVKRCADRDDGGVCVDGEGETVLRRTASVRRSTALTSAPWEGREMAVRQRGDLGWYHHLDMAALDGSVVRLWDGEVTAAEASPRRRRRRA